jgi:hypothetical protein
METSVVRKGFKALGRKIMRVLITIGTAFIQLAGVLSRKSEAHYHASVLKSLE